MVLFVTCSVLTLVPCAGTNALPADTLASYAAMLCRTLPAVVVPAALKKVKDARSHEECLQALQHLHMLCSRQTVSCCQCALTCTQQDCNPPVVMSIV